MTGTRSYTLDGPIGRDATLGLIVLQVDETIEQDFRRFFPDPGTALYVTRIPSGAELTPATILRMQTDLPEAARLLPAAARFDTVAYACTSGTTLIGIETVTRLVSENLCTRHVTNPLSAAFAACDHLRLRRLAIVSPYVAEVAAPVADAFRGHGLSVSAALSFGEQIEARAARIAPRSVFEAALEIGASHEIDGVFLSCTNLRCYDIIAPLEEALGKPVLSSNQVLAWHMAKQTERPPMRHAPGALFRTP